MIYTGHIAYTEAVYDRIKKCELVDDCGEYVVLNWGIVANVNNYHE